MKTINCIVILLATFFCNFSLSKTQNSYLFFQTSGEWRYGAVYIDNEYKGNIFNGYAFITLSSGSHTLTMFKSSYGYLGRSSNYVQPNIRFKTEENRLTSLGTIAILRNGYNQNALFFLRNDESALKYTKLNFPNKHLVFSSHPILHPTLRYQNNILEDIRKKYLFEYHKNNINDNKFIASDLGLLAYSNENTHAIIDTGILDRIRQLNHSSEPIKPVFITALSELYVFDTEFKKIPTDETNPPTHGSQVNEWLFTIGNTGNLSYSKDLGQTWNKKETRISKNRYVQTMSAVTNKEFIFGPVTSSDYDNDYAKLVGYFVDNATAETREINWLKHVTADSVFHRVNGTLFMDPVTLGNKAFLFKYAEDKNKWKEVSLPNRHCEINLADNEIQLNCSRGHNFRSPDGSTWTEVQK